MARQEEDSFKKLSIRVPKHLYQRIDRWAMKREVSIAQAIRKILEARLGRPEPYHLTFQDRDK